jgi:hypothetical protein
MGRRYGNLPGLVMALAILAMAGLLLLVYPDGWEHRLVALIAIVIGALIVWHVGDYCRAGRDLAARRRKH